MAAAAVQRGPNGPYVFVIQPDGTIAMRPVTITQQDERRAVLEETSHHIAIGLEYLPAIARRLYHSRELGEPFDFLTWFEFAPEHAASFERLVSRLRESAEWRYVDREVDIRLSR